jgi:hypothetical protein
MESQPRKPIESLQRDFEQLLATAWARSSLTELKGAVRGFVTTKGMLDLDFEAHNSLKTIVDEIQRSSLGGRFSRAFIEKRVDWTLAEIAGTSSDKVKAAIQSQVKKLVESLSNEEIKEYSITVPVTGVRVWPPSHVFKVGKCSVYSLANPQETRWLGKILQDRGVSHLLKFEPPGGSEHWIKTVVKSAEEDSEKREEAANDQIHESLAVLMLYSILEKNAKIFWPKLPIIQIGERKASFTNAYVVMTQAPLWAGEHVFSSALPELVLGEDATNSFDKLKFDRLNDLLDGIMATKIEWAICRSLSVLYSSFSSTDLTWKYIGFVTALEMLLTQSQERSIRRNISERLAWLLGENPEDRRKIMQRMEEIYSRRSDIVHEAEKTENLIQDIFQLHIWVLYLIARLLDGSFKEVSQIRDWVRSKQLGF